MTKRETIEKEIANINESITRLYATELNEDDFDVYMAIEYLESAKRKLKERLDTL